MHNIKFGPNLFIESDNNNSSIIPISTTISTYYNNDGSIRKTRMRRGKTSVVNRPIRHLGTICLCYSDPKDCTTCSARVMSFDEITIETQSCIPSISHISPPTFVDCSFRKSAGSCSSSSSSSSSDGSSLFDNEFLIELGDKNDNSLSYFETKTSQTEEIDELLRHLKEKVGEVKEFMRSCSNTFGQVKLRNRGYQKEFSEMLLDFQHRTYQVFSEDREMSGMDTIDIFQDSCEKSYQLVRNMYMERMMDEDLMISNELRIEELRNPPSNLCPPSIEISDNLNVLEKEIENFLKAREENEPLTDDCLTCMSFDPGQIIVEN